MAPAVAQRNLATNQEVKLAAAIPILLLCLLTITLLSLQSGLLCAQAAGLQVLMLRGWPQVCCDTADRLVAVQIHNDVLTLCTAVAMLVIEEICLLFNNMCCCCRLRCCR